MYRYLLVMLALGQAQHPVQAEDWFRYRGPRLDGVSNEVEWKMNWPAAGPPTVWRAEVGTGFSSVVISESRVYTMGNRDNQDTVYCLNSQDGSVLWQHSYTCPTDPNEFEGGPTATPTVDGSDVFTLSRRGDLFCFDKVSGQIRWQVNVAELADVRIPAWGFAGSPLIIEDLIVLNVGEAGTGIDRKTGELLWKSGDRDAGYSTPVPISFPQQGSTAKSSEPTVAFGSARAYVCINARTGEELWRQRWLTTFGCNAADVILDGDRAFLSSGYNRGCALLDLSSGTPEVVWKHKDMQNQISSGVLLDGHIYGIHGDLGDGTVLRCLELDSGKVCWTEEGFRPGGLTATKEHRLLVTTVEGELVLGDISPTGFDLKSHFPVFDAKCWTAPVLSNGFVYCRSAEGTLVCLDLRK